MREAGRRLTARERAVLVVLVLYLTIALVLLTPIRGAFGGDDATGVALPPPAAAGADGEPASADPGLTAGDQTRARGIVDNDPSLAAALGGVGHSVVKAGPWTTSGADGAAPRVLGAAFVIAPERPVELRSVPLPGALYDQTEQARPPYQSVVNRVSGRNVTQLLVLVDLERGRVVNVSPGPGVQDLESSPPPGFRRTVPAPREGGR